MYRQPAFLAMAASRSMTCPPTPRRFVSRCSMPSIGNDRSISPRVSSRVISHFVTRRRHRLPRWRGRYCVKTQVSMPTKYWMRACGSSASGAIPTRVGTSSSLSPAISLPIRLRNAPSCKRPTSPGGLCGAVSFIRTQQPDVGQSAAAWRLQRIAVRACDRFGSIATGQCPLAACPLRPESGQALASLDLSAWYSSIPPLAVVFNLCDRRFDTRRMYDMASDEEAGRQILSIFMQHKVGVSGVLRRNNFMDVRDADFQRGLNKAVENRWIKIKLRDRYTYELTEAGLAAGLNAGLPPKPSG